MGGLDGCVGQSAVQRLPGRGTHESSEERVEPQESFTTFVVRSMAQGGFCHFFEDSVTFSRILTNCTPKLHIVPHSRFLPRKKGYGVQGYGVQFSVHPFLGRELVTDDFRSRGQANFWCWFCWRGAQVEGCTISRWGVREAVQVDSVRSTLVAANATELSSLLTKLIQRTRELLCRRLWCLLDLKTWFVGLPDAAA